MDLLPQHDALSRFMQLHAKRAGLSLRWTGKSLEDISMLCADWSAKTLLSQSLWNGMKELWDMPELKELPEPVYAKICAIILKAQACFELDLERRNQKAAAQPPGAT
jgi:hypothetical protein